MIDKVGVEKCAICGACADVCPQNCISFQIYYKSFRYPVIDTEQCIHCNRCETVCPAIRIPEKQKPISYLAAKNKDMEVLKRSSSGGVFYPLAKAVLSNGGYVCGAAYDSNFDVHHKIISQIRELPALCGSKYVQSDLSGCFAEFKKLLKEGHQVLFAGCPCQAAAMANYFGNKRENLIIVDFICHGAVSADVFREYRQYLEKKYKGKIVDFQFRHKANGWSTSGPRVEFDNGACYESMLAKDVYMQGYFNNLNAKECCFSCAYKEYHSGSDITLGDFWGVQHLLPEFYDVNGNSVVVCNTTKGAEVVAQIGDQLTTHEITEELIMVENSGLKIPFEANKDRERYFRESKWFGYIRPLKKYLHSPLPKRVYYTVKKTWKRLTGATWNKDLS